MIFKSSACRTTIIELSNSFLCKVTKNLYCITIFKTKSFMEKLYYFFTKVLKTLIVKFWCNANSNSFILKFKQYFVVKTFKLENLISVSKNTFYQVLNKLLILFSKFIFNSQNLSANSKVVIYHKYQKELKSLKDVLTIITQHGD